MMVDVINAAAQHVKTSKRQTARHQHVNWRTRKTALNNRHVRVTWRGGAVIASRSGIKINDRGVSAAAISRSNA